MKYLLLLFLVTFQISCKEESKNYTYTILDKDSIHAVNIQFIDMPEKALISGYLFVYGNECIANSDKNKCKLLTALNIADECSTNHINFLKKWFKNDNIMQSKLRNCPNLPHNFAIQNSFDKITLNRKGDTLSIKYIVKGINNSQEKSWNVHREDFFLIKNNTFLKLKSNRK